VLVCASVLRTLPPAAPPALPVAPARGTIDRVLYAAAFFLFLIYTMNSQPTDKAEGLGEDFVRGGQDQTPTHKKKRNSYERTMVKDDTLTSLFPKGTGIIPLRG
jgi:hypothetical protein